MRVERRLGSAEVLEVLAELMLERGVPAHIRSGLSGILCVGP